MTLLPQEGWWWTPRAQLIHQAPGFTSKSPLLVTCVCTVWLEPCSSIITTAVWVVGPAGLRCYSETFCFVFLHVWLCAFSHLQTGPPTAEGSLPAAKWRTSLNKHPVASTPPLLFIMGGKDSLQSGAFSAQKHLDVRSDGMSADLNINHTIRANTSKYFVIQEH